MDVTFDHETDFIPGQLSSPALFFDDLSWQKFQFVYLRKDP